MLDSSLSYLIIYNIYFSNVDIFVMVLLVIENVTFRSRQNFIFVFSTPVNFQIRKWLEIKYLRQTYRDDYELLFKKVEQRNHIKNQLAFLSTNIYGASYCLRAAAYFESYILQLHRHYDLSLLNQATQYL